MCWQLTSRNLEPGTLKGVDHVLSVWAGGCLLPKRTQPQLAEICPAVHSKKSVLARCGKRYFHFSVRHDRDLRFLFPFFTALSNPNRSHRFITISS